MTQPPNDALSAWDDATDPQLHAALLRTLGDVPAAHVDWSAMRASIVGDAAPLLLRNRQRRSWTSYVSRWAATTIPVGVAAAIGAVALLMTAPFSGGEHAMRPTFMDAVTSSDSARSLAHATFVQGWNDAWNGDAFWSEVVP